MSRVSFVALSLVFLCAGIALLVAAGRRILRRRAFLAASEVAGGEIVGFSERREGHERSYFAQVRFRTAAGHAITFESSAGSERPRERVGDAVRVRYRVEAPNHAEIDALAPLWGLALALGGLGAVCAFLGAGLLLGWIPA